jgi:hypothetical protein
MPAALSASPFENFSSLATALGESVVTRMLFVARHRTGSKHSASAHGPSHRRRLEKTRHGHSRAFGDALYHERRLLYRLYGNPRRENHRPHRRRTGRNPPHYSRRTLKNQILSESARYFCDVISRLKQAGAAGIILGCTEICLIVNEENSPLPVFDSTKIHALAAVDEALAG